MIVYCLFKPVQYQYIFQINIVFLVMGLRSLLKNKKKRFSHNKKDKDKRSYTTAK